MDDIDTDNDDDDDEDDNNNKNALPYKNRSLVWTERYRKLLPYETIRSMVIKIGLQSQQEWDEYIEDGNSNPYIPNRPDIMYEQEWESWDEFLGVIRPYYETRQVVQYILHLTNTTQYTEFIQHNKQRAEGLSIPANPELYYKMSGNWISNDDFFGTTNNSTSI